MKEPKITCICPTRGRFNSLRESISFFLLQDYKNKELIIFNNHSENLIPHPKLIKHNIKIINAGDYSGKSMQIIYNDTLKYVSEDTEYIAIWDDDDMYLPWHLSDNMNKLINSDKQAIRPKCGYWQDNLNATEYGIVHNTLEAGMIVKKELLFFDITVDNSSHGYTHPHIYWESKASKENKFLYNTRITSIYRWHFGLDNNHLQSSGPHNNNETGNGSILKPIGVKNRFYNFIENVTFIDVDDKILNINNSNKAMLLKLILDYNIDKFEHVDKYKVWLYWNDENIPSFLKLCHNSIRENTFSDVVVLNDNSISELQLPEFVNKYAPTQKADYLRIYLLNKYGGWWFDSDTYVVGDLDEYYFRYLINNETVFPWESNVYGNVIMALISSKPNGYIIRNALLNINNYLSKDPNVGWSGIGINGLIKTISELKSQEYWNIFGLNDIAIFGCNNGNIRQWTFDKIVTNKLQMIVFHWSEVSAELTWKLNVTGDYDSDLYKIINNYPNLSKLLDLYKKTY